MMSRTTVTMSRAAAAPGVAPYAISMLRTPSCRGAIRRIDRTCRAAAFADPFLFSTRSAHARSAVRFVSTPWPDELLINSIRAV
jgi:hypothetical protein